MTMVWAYVVLVNFHRIVLYVWQQMKEGRGGNKEMKMERKIGFG